MARIRTIKPEFFRNRKLYRAEQESSLPLRLAFAGLWVCADREGRFKWEPEELKLDALPWDDVDFAAVMAALEEIDAIRSYEIDGRKYGYIPAWKEHQVINNRESESALPPPPAQESRVPDATPTRDTRVQDATRGEGKGKEGKDASMTRGVNGHDYSPEFEQAWSLYPRREGGNPKIDAWKAWRARVGAGMDPADMIGGVERYAAFIRAKGKEGTEYVLQAATFFGPNQHFSATWELSGAPRREAGAIPAGNVL